MNASAQAASTAYTYETAAEDTAGAPRLPPTLLLFAHVEKTGGTSVRDWLQGRARKGEIDLFVPYRYARCFMLHRFHASVSATRTDRGTCGVRFVRHFDRAFHRHGGVVSRGRNASAVNWWTSRIAIEFHGDLALGFFAGRLLGSLSALRQRYAQRQGELLAFTLLREPSEHLASSFRFWPPCRDRQAALSAPARYSMQHLSPAAVERDCDLIGTYADFCAAAAGAQAGRLALLDRGMSETPQLATALQREHSVVMLASRCARLPAPTPRPDPLMAAGHPLPTTDLRRPSLATGSCERVVPVAMVALRALDLVAPTGCLGGLLRQLASRLGVDPPTIVPHRTPSSYSYPRRVLDAAQRASEVSTSVPCMYMHSDVRACTCHAFRGKCKAMQGHVCASARVHSRCTMPTCTYARACTCTGEPCRRHDSPRRRQRLSL